MTLLTSRPNSLAKGILKNLGYLKEGRKTKFSKRLGRST